VTRRKLRRLAERLARVGPIAHVVARSEAEASAFLEAFLAQKRQRARR
jgi:CelD/BcsL family acetyltransferase involved in cellulose biosynthesis